MASKRRCESWTLQNNRHKIQDVVLEEEEAEAEGGESIPGVYFLLERRQGNKERHRATSDRYENFNETSMRERSDDV